MAQLLKKVTTFTRPLEVQIPNDSGKPDLYKFKVTYRLGVRKHDPTMNDDDYVRMLVVKIEGIDDAENDEDAIETAACHDCVRPAIVTDYFDAVKQDPVGKNSRKSR
ncbi:hypothetical protein C7S18_12140 [Ahniella affigens]|uniref:Uncharacterized protein n=1 Tax=Ahniella affigens TaxID=2021234 RepID=A0A2P1PSU9_9GAMM|nr:hypothetical protein [Ahniella affigens]AVP97901.1 hypothetical protein C7S18_12140 [Ahniella affigens]